MVPKYSGVLNAIEASAQLEVDIRVVTLEVCDKVTERNVEVCYVIAMHEDSVLYIHWITSLQKL